jgi:hypothetical protein
MVGVPAVTWTAVLAYVTAAAGLLLAFLALWLIRRWRKAFLAAGRESALAYGTVTLGTGRELPVSSLRLRGGGVEFSFGLPGPVEGGRHVLMLRGADGVTVARTELDLPKRTRLDSGLLVTGIFRVDLQEPSA